MYCPPSTFSTVPVMCRASSDARKSAACATSSTVPSRPSTVSELARDFNSMMQRLGELDTLKKVLAVLNIQLELRSPVLERLAKSAAKEP